MGCEVWKMKKNIYPQIPLISADSIPRGLIRDNPWCQGEARRGEP